MPGYQVQSYTICIGNHQSDLLRNKADKATSTTAYLVAITC